MRLAEAQSARTPDENFAYGMSLAHLQRWKDARAALLEGHQTCPRQERFLTELAGVDFQQKQYAEASHWLRRALRLNPRDAYALDFAGTVEYLLGNLPAALGYWNQVRKPYVANLQLDPQLRLQHLVLDRAFAFAPQSLLTLPQYEATQARLQSLGIFPTYALSLNARPDGKFDAAFHAFERHGFGNSRTAALIAIFGGVPYQTIYPSYYDLHGTATNVESLLRWDSNKRRAWVALSSPLHALPQWRWQLATDERSENWIVRQSFTGTAPSLGSLHLDRGEVSGTLSAIPSGRLRWSAGAELSRRTLTHVVAGPALTPTVLAAGYQIKPLASVDFKLIDAPVRRLSVLTSASGEMARLWSSPSRQFGKLQGGALLNWLPQASDDKYELTQRVRGGGALGSVPFDELFLIGVERDTDLWYRGALGTRDGRKGSSPLADRYLLSNTDFYRRFYSNGLIRVHAGPLLDIARTGAPNAALAPSDWLVSAGAEAKITVLGTGVVLTYGRDLRSGANAFFATLAK